MELGELEVLVLKKVRDLGKASPRQIFKAVQVESEVAYTSVTTTLYRLVEKGLLRAERLSEKRVLYQVDEAGAQFGRFARVLGERYLDAFGRSSLLYLLDRAHGLSSQEIRILEEKLRRLRRREV